jgi:gluconate kinase
VGHFAPVALLVSQLATLEEPGPHDVLIVDASLSPEEIVQAVRKACRV